MQLQIQEKIGAATWIALSEEKKYIIRKIPPERLGIYLHLQEIQHKLSFIPKIIKFGNDRYGNLYLVEEYIIGKSLDNFTNEFIGNKKRTLMFFAIISYQLYQLHQLGILHGDIKPENIVISLAEKKAYFVDFEFAQLIDSKNYAPSIGYTPFYCSIEQLESKLIFPATDIRALGILTLELFLGYHPIFPNNQTSSPTIIARMVAESEVKFNTNDAFLRLLEKMIRVNPQERIRLSQIIDIIEPLIGRKNVF